MNNKMKGRYVMNYVEWSKEYYETAEQIGMVIDKLKNGRNNLNSSEKKEIDQKIAQYKIYYNECILIANHLAGRANKIYA